MTGRRYPLGAPPGFPNCRTCLYVSAGSAVQCVECAGGAITTVGAPSCSVCDQALGPQEHCRNWLCTRPTRYVQRIRAIAVHTGPLRAANHRLKYDGMWGWSIILGRLLFGWVERNIDPANEAIIVGNPTFLGPGSRSVVEHTELVIESAEAEDVLGQWSWDVAKPRVLRKTAATPQSAATGFAGKREAAAALPGVLELTQPGRIAGRHVLVYDDVCTTGLQLDAVAGFLLGHGAVSVDAVVLARAPWS